MNKSKMQVLVVGYPKTGNTWLCRLLGDVLDCPVGAIYKPASRKAIVTEGRNRLSDYYVGQGHPIPSDRGKRLIPSIRSLNLNYLQDEKIILICRDPRDVCVSAMHYWGMEDIYTAIEKVAEGKWPVFHGGGFMLFYKKWYKYSDKIIVHTSYERLLADTALELKSILVACQMDCKNDIKRVVKRQSFTTRRRYARRYGDSLNYGRDFQLQFLRKGIVGDWVNYFDDKAIEMSEHYFNDYFQQWYF